MRRGSIRKHVSSMACGARNLTSTRLWCWASLGWERVSVPVTPVPVNTQEQRAIAALVLCCERLGMGRISALGQRAPKKLVSVTLALS